MKYIGSRTTSKNTKKRIRSWATKVPTMPVSRMRMRMRKAFGLPGSGKWFQRVDDAERHDEQGEGQQRQRDAVEADDVAAVDDVDPVLVDDELQLAGVVVVEVGEQQRRRSPPTPSVAPSATTL